MGTDGDEGKGGGYSKDFIVWKDRDISRGDRMTERERGKGRNEVKISRNAYDIKP